MSISTVLSEISPIGIDHALKVIEQRYERSNYLPFHNTGHTIDVIKRSEILAKAMQLPEEQIRITKLISSFHDIGRFNQVVQNELLSFNEFLFWIRTQNIHLSCDDLKFLKSSFMSTVVDYDLHYNTVFQPNLHFDSHPIIRCVALADLGAAGMEGESFAKESDLRFRESNLDISHAIMKNKGHSITVQDQEAYRKRMIKWLEYQIVFSSGRKVLLEKELGNLDEGVKKKIRGIFSKFDEGIALVKEVINSRQSKDFWSISVDMGYDIDNSNY